MAFLFVQLTLGLLYCRERKLCSFTNGKEINSCTELACRGAGEAGAGSPRMVQWSSSRRWEWIPVITCCSGLPVRAGSRETARAESREIKAGGRQGSPKRALVLSRTAGLSCVTAAVSLSCHPDARSARVSRAAVGPWKGTGFRPAARPRSPASPPAHPRKTRQAKGHPFHLKCISF